MPVMRPFPFYKSCITHYTVLYTLSVRYSIPSGLTNGRPYKVQKFLMTRITRYTCRSRWQRSRSRGLTKFIPKMHHNSRCASSWNYGNVMSCRQSESCTVIFFFSGRNTMTLYCAIYFHLQKYNNLLFTLNSSALLLKLVKWLWKLWRMLWITAPCTLRPVATCPYL